MRGSRAVNHLEEAVEPVEQRSIMDQPTGEVLRAHLSTRKLEALRTADSPAVHHGKREFGVKLDAPGIIAVTEGLVRIGFRTRKKLAAAAKPPASAASDAANKTD